MTGTRSIRECFGSWSSLAALCDRRSHLKSSKFREVPWEDGRSILVLRVPQSWARPHQVRNTGLFYGRGPGGAYVLDVSELKELFDMAERVPEQAIRFVQDQLNRSYKPDVLYK